MSGDQIEDDYIVIPISKSDLNFAGDEIQVIPDKIVQDHDETGQTWTWSVKDVQQTVRYTGQLHLPFPS